MVHPGLPVYANADSSYGVHDRQRSLYCVLGLANLRRSCLIGNMPFWKYIANGSLHWPRTFFRAKLSSTTPATAPFHVNA